MGRSPLPIAIIEANGNSRHLSKDKIDERKRRELNVPFTDVHAPSYLTKAQAQKFDYIAGMLLQIGVMTELDVDCLGRYIVAHDLYIKYTKEIKSCMRGGLDLDELQKVQNMQAKAFQQAQASARELGLTVTSRCRITMPPTRDPDDDEL